MDTTSINHNNLLLISGTGRKTGKTSFACQLIQQHSDLNIIAIKMSCHFHLQQELSPFLEQQNEYQIYVEQNTTIPRDSSRMLAAGASKVFYIQAVKDFAIEAFRQLLPFLPSHTPVICESGGLGSYISPGMHVAMRRSKPLAGDKTITYQPDYFNRMEKNGFIIPPAHFHFFAGNWAYLPLFYQEKAALSGYQKHYFSRTGASMR